MSKTYDVVVLGAGPAFLGVIEGVAEASSSLLKLAGGVVADRFGRRKWLVAWGYGIAAAGRPLIAVATNAWQVLGIRFAERVGKGLRTAPLGSRDWWYLVAAIAVGVIIAAILL